MNIKTKPMKLSFIKKGDVWDKVISDLDGNIIYEEKNNILLEENNNKEYFDEWEQQTKQLPTFNIVDVERFI